MKLEWMLVIADLVSLVLISSWLTWDENALKMTKKVQWWFSPSLPGPHNADDYYDDDDDGDDGDDDDGDDGDDGDEVDEVDDNDENNDNYDNDGERW